MAPEDLVRDITKLMREGNREELISLLRNSAREGRLSDALATLSTREIHELADTLGDDAFGELLGELDPSDAAQLLTRLAIRDAADVLEAMDPDDAADVVGEFDDAAANRFLIEMEPVEAAELRQLLSYPPDTAGGRMTPAFIAISPDLRADQAVVALRQLSEEAETIYYVYVTDEQDHLIGVLSLRHLVLSPPNTPVRNVMVTDIVTVRVDADQEEAARVLTDNDLLALPVVNHDGKLEGIITADDIADILEQEATEDFQRVAGVVPLQQSLRDVSAWVLYKNRIRWLVILVFVNVFSGAAIASFEETIETVVALVFFLPLLIDSGGNAGAQSATLVIRALATGEAKLRDWGHLFAKEILTAGAMGLTMAVAVSWLGIWRGGFEVGLVVMITMILIVLVGSLIGMSLPFILTRVGIDPAVASGPLVTSLADICGVMIYFSIATWYLL
ncbi:MAG: magnesium transporter [Sphaerobacteraceae bacterium]|nr:MAG: magnesium transporter [Sphaerobacteraceae bacterium]